MSRISEAWDEASPLNPYRAGAFWHPTRGYVQLVALLRVPHSLYERSKALVHLIRPDERCDYLGRRARIHAALCLLLPIHWHYPDHRKCRGDEVTSWDEARLGGETASWEATFIATRRWGVAHIYREGGP